VPKLPRVTSIDTIRTLEKLGFVQVRQRGSHIILKKQLSIEEAKRQGVNEVGCVVPMSRKTLAIGTLKSILTQSGVTIEQFIKHLK
jgi:predicted RNA binding protein YcfA (HicA-like mRNA interferase family)